MDPNDFTPEHHTGSNFNFSNSGYKNVATIGLTLLILAIIPVSTFFLNRASNPHSKADTIPSASLSTSEFGFNTHLTAAPEIGVNTNLTIVAFKKAVDDLVAHNQKWIRFNVNSSEVVYVGTNTPNIIWNDVFYPVYDEAINYAYSKGLKIFLVTGTPDFAKNFNTADHLLALQNYHSWLADRYKGKITVWQVFNEPDYLHYQYYTSIPFGQESQDPYYSNLVQAFNKAKETIKSKDPNVLVTTNFGRYPLNSAMFANLRVLLDKINSYLDIITLDLYPDGTYPGLSDEINKVKTYNKPIIIAETGKPSYFYVNGADIYDEKSQGELTAYNINEMKLSNPLAIIAYEYQDSLPVGTTVDEKVQSSFGVVKSDGVTHKASYDHIMTALTAPIPFKTGLLRVQTDPAVPVDITVTELNTNQVVMTRQWGVNWESLPIGNYKIHFTFNGVDILGKPVKIPQDSPFAITENQTTTLMADLTTYGLQITPPQTGLLRVQTNPAAPADIVVKNLNTGQVVLQKQWGIDWNSLPVGNYLLHFDFAGTDILGKPTKIPGDKTLTVFPNQTTTVVADLTTYGELIDPVPLVATAPTPTPVLTGTLRVETNPAAEATIKVVAVSTGTEIGTNKWFFNQSLPVGQYRVSFTYPYATILGNRVNIPPLQTVQISADRTTKIVADLTRGTAPVSYP